MDAQPPSFEKILISQSLPEAHAVAEAQPRKERTTISQSRFTPRAKVTDGRLLRRKSHPSQAQRKRFRKRITRLQSLDPLVLQIEEMNIQQDNQLSPTYHEFDVQQIQQNVLQFLSELSL